MSSKTTLPIVEAKMSFLDWPTPDGVATVVFVAGCSHNCAGCHSPQLQDASLYPEIEVDKAAEVIEAMSRHNRTKNIVFSGGDPLFHSKGISELMEILTGKDCGYRFCIYTGFEFEQASKMISGFEFMKTGVYDELQRQESCKTDFHMVLASKNQKMFDRNGKCLSVDGEIRF